MDAGHFHKDTQPTFKAWWNIVFGNYVYKQCWQTKGLVGLIPELDVSITCQQKIIIKTAFDPSMHIFPVNDFHCIQHYELLPSIIPGK